LPHGEVRDRVPLPVRVLVGTADSRVAQNLPLWHRCPSKSVKWVWIHFILSVNGRSQDRVHGSFSSRWSTVIGYTPLVLCPPLTGKPAQVARRQGVNT